MSQVSEWDNYVSTEGAAETEQNTGNVSEWDKYSPSLRDAQQDLSVGESAKKLGKKIVGDPEFSFDAIEDRGDVLPSSDASFKIGRALWSGSEKNMENTIKEVYPGAVIQYDKNGYQYFSHPSVGHLYTEKPGLDTEDVASGAAKLASYVLGGALSAGTKLPLMGKMLSTFFAEAGVDAGVQKVGGEDIDPIRAGVSGLAGSASEVLGPAWNTLKTIWKQTKSKPAVIAEARRLGYELNDIEINQMAREVAESGDEIADVVGRNEFGFVTTRGQRTGDFRQLAKEEKLKAKGSGPLIAAEQQNVKAVERQVEKQTGGRTANQSAAEAQESIVEKSTELKKKVKNAYSELGNPEFNGEATKGLENRMRNSVKEFGEINDDTPAARQALSLIRKETQGAMSGKRNTSGAFIKDERGSVIGMQTKLNAPVDEALTPRFDLEHFDGVRKQLGNMYGRAKNDTDRAMLTIMRKEYDNWADDVLEDALASGDPGVYQQLKEARALRAEYGRLFQMRGKDDDAGAMIEKMVRGDRTPEEVINLLTGANMVGKASAARMVKRYKEAGGDVESIKRLLFYKVATKHGQQTAGEQALVNNLREALGGKGESLFREVYTPDELEGINRFVKALDQIVAKGGFAKSSGTTERLWRFIGGNGVLGRLPFLENLGSVKDALAARYALGFGERAVTSPVIKGAASYAGSESGQQQDK